MNQPATAYPSDSQRLTPAGSPILSNQEGSFAWSVLAQRHPALIEQVRRAHPYGPQHLARLDALLEEITYGSITALPATAHDHARWQTWPAAGGEDRAYVGRSWFDVPFLWAESYFYRRLLEAVDYYGDGPWAGVDPFEPAKSAELAQVGELITATSQEDLLMGCVWGNRADLGFRVAAPPPRFGPRATSPRPLITPSPRQREESSSITADRCVSCWAPATRAG